MQFSKSAGKHWTELWISLSLSSSLPLSLLFFYFPTSRPVPPLSLSTFLAIDPLSSAIDEFSRGGTLSAFQTLLWDTRANLYLLFRWNLRHTAIRRIFWSNCSPREKRSFVKYASHSSDCNRRMRNACRSILPLPHIPLFIEWNVEIPPFLSCLSFDFPPPSSSSSSSHPFVRWNGHTVVALDLGINSRLISEKTRDGIHLRRYFDESFLFHSSITRMLIVFFLLFYSYVTWFKESFGIF